MGNRKELFSRLLQTLVDCKSNPDILTRTLLDVCKTVSSVQLPAPSTQPVIQSDIDIHSTSLIPPDFPSGYVALQTSPNGSCFYNAISRLLVNTEDMAAELRVRTIVNIFLLLSSYTCDVHLNSKIKNHMKIYLPFSGQLHNIHVDNITDRHVHSFLQSELLYTIDHNSWSGMTQIQCLSNAISCSVWSIYPDANKTIRNNFNLIVQPWTANHSNTWLFPVLWTGYYINNDWLVANHFVPLVCTERVKQNPFIHSPFCASTYTVTVSKPRLTPLSPRQHKDVKQSKKQRETSLCASTFECFRKLPKHYCVNCQQLILRCLPVRAKDAHCSTCKRLAQHGYNPLQRSSFNPGEIPAELAQLSDTEIHMISRVHPYLKLLKLPAGGQFAQTGQCINFPVNIQTVCSVLPRAPSHDTKVLVYNAKKTNRPSLVNMKNLYIGLQWLIDNNELYSDVSVCDVFPDMFRSTQNINEDFEDTCSYMVPTQLCQEYKLNTNCHTNVTAEKLPSPVQPCSDLFTEHTPPKRMRTGAEDINVVQDVSLIPSDYTVPIETLPVCTLPWIKTDPINIFQHNKAEELSFPKLFPRGTHGFKMINCKSLTLKQYFQCRLLSKDERWAACPSYLFWALYVYEQHSLQNQISVAIRTRNAAINLTAVDILRNEYKHKVAEDYRFMKTMKGTAAYWREQLHNLMAKIRILGPPTFFLSLSSNDMSWLEMFKFIDPDLPDSVLPLLTSSAKVEMICKNPVKAALYFSRRWESYLHSVLLSNTSPLGTVSDYFARIEFQNRGSPHVHAFFWVANAPNFETTEGRLHAPEFIDKYITASLPTGDSKLGQLVNSLQVHRHTFSCQRSKYSTACRFDFPRAVSPCTKVQLTNTTSKTARFYQLRRDAQSQWINPYNEQILTSWNANIDIQIVGCKYAAAVYVCTYVCKNEPNSLKTAISSAIKSLPEYFTNRQKLSKIGNVLLTHRIISAQEAAFRILHLPMVYSSRTTIFIPSSKPEDQHKILKPKKALEALPDDSEDIFIAGLHNKYMRRPDSKLFNEMSLVQFATKYKFFSKCPKTKPDSYKLLGEPDTWIRQRQKPACFRSYIPDATKYRSQFCYAMLCLFLPWRNPHDIIYPYDTAEEAYLAKEKLLDRQSIQQYSMTEKLLSSLIMVRSLSEETQTNIHCSVAPSFMANELDTKSQEITCVDSVFSFTETEPSENTDNKYKGLNSEEFKSLSVYRYTLQQYEQRLSSLSADQRDVIRHIESTLHSDIPIYLFVSGGAGTGKSYLLQTLREHLLRCSSSDHPNVVVAAPTGVAAFNIKGWTLHRLLNLDVQHKSNAPYLPLSSKMLEKLRDLFRSVRYLIIDEISMVSINMLIQIHKRLCEIKSTSSDADSYFGNISVIAFGDLYQLKPVYGGFIFSEHEDLGMCHIWRDLFVYHELHTNFRQQDDSVYLELLNRARFGKLTNSDIILLNTRLVPHNTIPNNIQRVLPKKAACKAFNDTQNKETVTGKLYTINAKDEPDTAILDDENECGGLFRTLKLGVGSRVMLQRNIETNHGLVNGAQGTVVDIQWSTHQPDQSCDNFPACVIVQFDDETIGSVFDDNTHSPVAIKPLTVTFYDKNKVTVNRTQFPLCVSFAVTVHKIQGITLPSAAIDIGPDIFTGGMAYVALSRVGCLSDLHLLNFAPTKVYAFDKVHKEMERLRSRKLQSSHLEAPVNK